MEIIDCFADVRIDKFVDMLGVYDSEMPEGTFFGDPFYECLDSDIEELLVECSVFNR